MSYLRTALIAATALASFSAAQAATVSFGSTPATFSPITTGLIPTTFSTTLNIPTFNPSLGTLNSVTLSFAGGVNSNISFESLDASASTVTGTASATVTLSRPAGGAAISVVLPTNQRIQDETAYDGTNDFQGTSGDTFTNVSGSLVAPDAVLTSAADKALFTSPGGSTPIPLGVRGVGTSSVSGPGNVDSRIRTQASGSVFVTYDYTPTPTPPPTTVPEPASLALIGAGLAGLGLLRRRK